MFALLRKVRQLMSGDRRAVTALEYGLIAAVVGGVVITASTNFGDSLSSAYTSIGSTLSSKASGM